MTPISGEKGPHDVQGELKAVLRRQILQQGDASESCDVVMNGTVRDDGSYSQRREIVAASPLTILPPPPTDSYQTRFATTHTLSGEYKG